MLHTYGLSEAIGASTQPHRRASAAVAFAILCVGSAHCGFSEASDGDMNAGMPPGAAGSDSGGDQNGSGGDTLPPENENDSSFRSPVATGRYVWIANPLSGRVAYVDAVTLNVETALAGNGPTYLAAVPDADDDVAIVINSASNDATLLRNRRGDGINTGIDTAFAPLHPEANSWAVSASGRWAIAWSDARSAANAKPSSAFQDVTVVELTSSPMPAKQLTVGYRPTAIAYNVNESEAYVITQDGISVISLRGADSSVDRLVRTSDDPFDSSDASDITITPDGVYAFVRRNGDFTIPIIPLSGGTPTRVELPGPCTDLDLSTDGSVAVAVVRSTNQIAILPIPDIVSSPDQFELIYVDNVMVGSVSLAAEAQLGIAYSTASQEQRAVAIDYSISPVAVTPLKLYSDVLSTVLAPNGRTAIVVHGDGTAFSALVLNPLLPSKIVGTVGEIMQVVLSQDGAHAVLASRNDFGKTYAAYLVDGFSQQVTPYELLSPPIAVGLVPQAGRAYVAQEHPDGRITFLDLETGGARTLTGFELAARVVDGSEP